MRNASRVFHNSIRTGRKNIFAVFTSENDAIKRYGNYLVISFTKMSIFYARAFVLSTAHDK